MSVLTFGLNYKSAPIDLLERVAVASEQLPKALSSLISRTHVTEAVLLSTCNRVEAYAHVTRYHGGVADLRDFFAEWAGLAPEDVADHAYEYHDAGAAAHLFAVTSGLDSMVLGERQIQLQVKDAFARAEREGTTGRTLHALFRRALGVGKRARAETDLAAGGASMVDVGLDAVAHELGGLDGRVALVVGAGKMGGMAATRLAAGRGRILVANRTADKAARLAGRVGAEVAGLDALHGALERADFAVCSTGSSGPVVDAEVVAAAMASRPDRPLVLLDLAVPRDVDPACREVPGVTVLDIEAIRGAAAAATPAGVAGARALVAEEVERFGSWTRATAVEPLIAMLRARAETVRRTEIQRLAPRFADLSSREREALEAVTKGIVNTLLHEPTIRLKALADARADEHYADALRELFDLPPGEE